MERISPYTMDKNMFETNHLEKYESDGIIIPNIWKIKAMFQTPNQPLYSDPVVSQASLNWRQSLMLEDPCGGLKVETWTCGC